jgi:glutamine cyclotransferase
MNGIAYNPANNNVYITGKMWPNIYEIAFNH